ncbi:alpha-ketoglutarate-dependent dioxygenase AlkB [Methylobacterium brachythecii]|uniref:Alkylated DNA repair dioxygenase n=1 Tax=Methylobacterium brachythecii TaxID=1176177 RepID=A0A7W6AEP0_9HYPH|nr:alpha-ketoglutarate-dependent dioxygenase AlkB [Methylobacterium brachythecii]MBB3901913.1 alkylated DNA repair protein (DNA oxidative demethylase) [Methylobacterium brachythecii]GLS43293.1 alkylated DNA repair dioxygenase [Methylobacterium brachythecii]
MIHYPGWLDAQARLSLATALAAALDSAPPYTPRMPRTGKPFSVRMTNCGPLGWVSGRDGYRYQPNHPETGARWPAIPETALEAWDALGGYTAPPEACLVNLYDPGTRMGLHQDRDEEDLAAPVVSLSLGATALFRYGGLKRSDPTRSIRLASGDALVMGGASRLVHHGVDRLIDEPPQLFAGDRSAGDGRLDDVLRHFLAAGGRCNLTLRRVTQPRDRPGA